MQKNNPNTIRYITILAGALCFVLPGLNTEIEILYTLSPWIWQACFLYYTRTIEKKRDWLLFALLFLISHEIRFVEFLGDTEQSFGLIAALLLVLLSAAAAIPFFLDWIFQKYTDRFLMVFVFPLARVGVERFIIGQQFNLSLTQFGNKWLIQSAAFLGDKFITFVVALIPSVIIFVILNEGNRKMLRYGIAVLSVFWLIVLLGGIRYLTGPRPEGAVSMAYASGPQKTYYENPSETDADYRENVSYLRRTTRQAAKKGAKLIAYAEEAFMADGKEVEDITRAARDCAKENDIYILICLDCTTEDGTAENKAVLISNAGEVLSEYLKTNLIPVIEDEYKAGDGVIPSNHITIDGREQVVSYTICYDATFSSYLLSMDPATTLFINPSWDWDRIDDLNYRMQGISAVESGVVLFKPTVDGWSIVTDPYGRVIYKESTLWGDYNQVHFAEVPGGSVTTVYQRIHKYTKWTWTLLVLAVLIWLCKIVIAEVRLRK